MVDPKVSCLINGNIGMKKMSKRQDENYRNRFLDYLLSPQFHRHLDDLSKRYEVIQ